MKLSDWQKHPELQKVWAETWNQPAMVLGLDVLKESFRSHATSKQPSLVAGLDPLAAGAILNAFREGAEQAINHIELLKQALPSTSRIDDIPGWANATLKDEDSRK